MEVLRLKTNDLDQVKTVNWQTEFDIVKGNEAGYFSVKTDPITNEGVLMLDKVQLKQHSSVQVKQNLINICMRLATFSLHLHYFFLFNQAPPPHTHTLTTNTCKVKYKCVKKQF